MKYVHWARLVVGGISISACGPSPAPVVDARGGVASAPTAKATPTAGKATATSKPVISRQATATDFNAALAELAPPLAADLVGADWSLELERARFADLDWPGWLTSNDVVRRDPATGGYVAALTSAQVEQLLSEFASKPTPAAASVPPAWQATLGPALAAEQQWTVCQHKQQWLNVTCSLQPPMNERIAVSNWVANLRLQPVLPDGVPIAEDGRLLWPIGVMVQSTDSTMSGVAGVPVQLAMDAAATGDDPTDASSLVAVSDEHGVCRFALGQGSQGAHVRVAPASLGPLASAVQLPELVLTTRGLEPRRHLVLEVSARGDHSPPHQELLGSLVQREFAVACGATPVALPRDLVRALRSDPTASPHGTAPLQARLREDVVNATRGSLDYVVLVWGTSEFASQMGADRTWYEAHVGAKVLEVWSGAVIASFEEKAMGADIGDAAAERAALAAAARQLTVRLRQALGVP